MAESKFYQAKWFKIGAGALGSLFVLLLLVPFLVSVDDFIPQITGLIEEQTGRKAEIETIRVETQIDKGNSSPSSLILITQTLNLLSKK